MRCIILTAAVLSAATAYAIDTTHHPARIALLAPHERWADPRDARELDFVRDQVKNELQKLGYEPFATAATIDEAPAADYCVEILGAGGEVRPVAGIGAGPVDLAVSVSRVAASMNVYDGRTLELIDTIDLHKRSTSVAPVGVSFGGRSVWAAIAVPVFEWSHYRSAIRALAHDAARQIDEALRR